MTKTNFAIKSDSKECVYYTSYSGLETECVVALGNQNQVLRGEPRITIRKGDSKFGDQIFFDFYVKEIKEKLPKKSIHNTVEVYMNLDEGIQFLKDTLQWVEEIRKNNITTYVFVSPIFPKITNYEEIISKTRVFTDYYLFENLNFRTHNISRILRLIEKLFPEKLEFYRRLRRNQTYWERLELEIKRYCKTQNIDCKIEFHHGGFLEKK